ncbi:semaphorin-5B-like protein [Labeo rohita]|uniref:Semaphorin-5B-like protein n=1 Tax=Labeo rohita TaxID=84645 RepID=A0A498MF67_LABRO|nr:semaphorin-5B-like protein [Labeo rohita]
MRNSNLILVNCCDGPSSDYSHAYLQVFSHAFFSSPSEPHFISAYDVGLFTFFFLRENAVEHDCGKTVYSRVARVCKNDIGGRFLLEDTWTTFTKARLNCSRSGEIPFYYNELQSTFYLPEQDLIYGIFTTNV